MDGNLVSLQAVSSILLFREIIIVDREATLQILRERLDDNRMESNFVQLQNTLKAGIQVKGPEIRNTRQ